MCRFKRKAQGCDRKAYEHELAISGRCKAPGKTTTQFSARKVRKTFLFKLEDPLNTTEAVRTAAAMADIPDTVTGHGDNGETTFCCVNGSAKQ